jgi:hypothetical protein
MTPENPIQDTNIESAENVQMEQQNTIKRINSDLESPLTNIQLDGIGMIPKIIDPIMRKSFEERAWKIIERIMIYTDLGSPESISTSLKAMEYINNLSGNLKNQALRIASGHHNFIERYNKLDRNNLYEVYFKDFFKHTKKGSMKSATAKDFESISKDAERILQNSEIASENHQHVSEKEKIGWILHLLRSESWAEIKEGVKLFYAMGKVDEDKIPAVLIESIEKKIIDLIIYGLNSREGKDKMIIDKTKTRAVLFFPPPQKNSVYANLMAIDLISYVPEKFRKNLIEIAEQNEEMGPVAKEKIDKLK